MAFLLPLLAPAIPWLVNEFEDLFGVNQPNDNLAMQDDTDMFDGEEF